MHDDLKSARRRKLAGESEGKNLRRVYGQGSAAEMQIEMDSRVGRFAAEPVAIMEAISRNVLHRKSFDRYAPLDHPSGLRQCGKCGSWLPLEAFARSSCRACLNQLKAAERTPERKRYQANRSGKLKRKRAYYRKKPAVSRPVPQYKAKRRQSERQRRLAKSIALRVGKKSGYRVARKARTGDLTGQTFSLLTVIARAENQYGHRRWLCRCECGGECIVRARDLVQKNTGSCGCNRRKRLPGFSNTIICRTPVYRVWESIKQRCSNPAVKAFRWCGARGIGFDPAWQQFEGFLRDMGPTYFPHAHLHRRDHDKGYDKDNCVWVAKLTSDDKPVLNADRLIEVVKAHPGCTGHDVAKRVERTYGTVYEQLSRLEKAAQLRRELGGGNKPARFYPI